MSTKRMLSMGDMAAIKEAAPITQVLEVILRELQKEGKAVGVEPTSNGVKLTCLFHEERNPSLHVDRKREFYHCFGCGKSGDSISLVQEALGIGFRHALSFIGDKFPKVQHILRDANYNPMESDTEKEIVFDPDSEDAGTLVEIMQFLQDYYQEQLWTNKSERASVAREYLNQRNISSDLARKFGIGFAPLNDVAYALLCKKFKITPKELPYLLPRLGIVSSNGFTLFNGRVTFPIGTLDEKVLGFSARQIAGVENGNKYINSTEGVVFSKKRLFQGLQNLDRQQVMQRGLYLVEGITDCFGFHIQGRGNVIAFSSAAMTDEQIGLVHHLRPKQVYMVTDGDEAGVKAAIRNANRMCATGFFTSDQVTGANSRVISVTIVPIDEGKDPFDMFYTDRVSVDEYIRERGEAPEVFIRSQPDENLLSKLSHNPLSFLEENTYHLIERSDLRERFPGLDEQRQTRLKCPTPHSFITG